MEESLEVELIFEDEEGKTSLTGNLPVCLQGSCTRKERQMKRNIVIQCYYTKLILKELVA